MNKKRKALKVAVLLSGGKDGWMACFKAIQEGYRVEYLFNLAGRGTNFSCFHNTTKDMVKMQSKASGIPLFQKEIYPKKDNREQFERELKELTLKLIDKGIKGLVFGYILSGDYERVLAKRLCSELNLTLIEPLYNKNSKKLLNEFVKLGFKTVIINVDFRVLDSDWVGRVIDENFIKYLETKPEVDPCGDGGEYHTFVVDGPLFKKKIQIKEASRTIVNNCCLLDIQQYSLTDKFK